METIYSEVIAMSLLEIGPTIFGDTDEIIDFLTRKGLLASSMICAR